MVITCCRGIFTALIQGATRKQFIKILCQSCAYLYWYIASIWHPSTRWPLKVKTFCTEWKRKTFLKYGFLTKMKMKLKLKMCPKNFINLLLTNTLTKVLKPMLVLYASKVLFSFFALTEIEREREREITTSSPRRKRRRSTMKTGKNFYLLDRVATEVYSEKK